MVLEIVGLLLLLISRVASSCSLDFATGATFDSLVKREGYTVLFVYNPQGKFVESQVEEVLNFSVTARARYPLNGPESIYCPQVVLADGVSFDPFEERIFQRIRNHARFNEETPSEKRATVYKAQSMGFDSSPALALLRGGKVIEVWDADISAMDMMNMHRSSVDSDEESRRMELATESDALSFVTDPNRRSKISLIVPHFTRITDDLRRDIYAMNATVIRPTKGSKASKALFSDPASEGQLFIYSVVPTGYVVVVDNVTEDVLENGNAHAQWERRLREHGLSLLRAPIEKASARLLGASLNTSVAVASLVTPRVAEGYRHILGLSAAKRRSNCVVTLFLKELTDGISEIYRGRLSKVAEVRHENSTLGDRCTFLVADADHNSRYFTSFGLMFRSLYRNAQDGKGRPSPLLLPQSRQRFADNLIGVSFDGRRYLYTEASFNVPLLAQFVKRVLTGRVVRLRKCEEDRGLSSYASRSVDRIHFLNADCDTLYYDGLRDFRKDTLVVMLPSSDARMCFQCNGNGTRCEWNASTLLPSICQSKASEGQALGEVFKLLKPSISTELSVVYYVPSANDLNPYLRLPKSPTSNEAFSLVFMNRADKLAYFKRQTAFQPGVHDSHLTQYASDTLKVTRLVLASNKGSLSNRMDRIVQFIHEGGESLAAHMIELPAFVSTSDEDLDEDEF